MRAEVVLGARAKGDRESERDLEYRPQSSDFRLWILLPYPVYEVLRNRHSGKPALTNQRPVGEFWLLLDLGEGNRRVDAAGVLQIDDGGLGIFRIVARLGADGGETHDR